MKTQPFALAFFAAPARLVRGSGWGVRWALVLALLGGAAAVRAADPAPAAGPQVPVRQLGAQAVDSARVFDGTLQAVRQTTLSAQASGRITRLLVKAGDRVRAGQTLVEIDDRQAQAGLAQTQAGVAQAQAQQAQARAHAERTRSLRAQGFISAAVLDQAESALKAANAGVAAAQAGQTQSRVAQGFTRLTAAFDGWVLSTEVEVGDLALPGSPLLTVYAPQPMRAVAHVPASLQAQALAASRTELLLPAADGATRVLLPSARSALPAADPVAQTVEWRLELAPADSQGLVPGSRVQVRFVGAASERLVLPDSALLRRGELTAVYLAQPAGAQPGFVLRAVRLGRAHGQGSAAGHEVVAGVVAGDRVALDPVRAGLAGAQPVAE